MKEVSFTKLRVNSWAGDDRAGVGEDARMAPHDWLVADLLLLHEPGPRPLLTHVCIPRPALGLNESYFNRAYFNEVYLWSQESFLLYEQLQPLIDVFHLAQVHHLEEHSHRDPISLRWTRAHRDYYAKLVLDNFLLYFFREIRQLETNFCLHQLA